MVLHKMGGHAVTVCEKGGHGVWSVISKVCGVAVYGKRFIYCLSVIRGVM